jgi:hypothetical protein
VEFIGDSDVRRFDRGNRGVSWTFKTVFDFGKIEDAEKFATDWASRVPRVGTVILNYTWGTRYIPDAEVQASVLIRGYSVEVGYQITGGRITSVSP